MTVSGKPAQTMDALFAKAALLETTGPQLPVSFPEQHPPFEPPDDGMYLAVSYFPNRPAWEGLSAGVLDQGLLQVAVVWPKNKGLIAAATVASQVQSHFAKGTIMVSGATKVKVTGEPVMAQPIPEDDKVLIPVTIPWTA